MLKRILIANRGEIACRVIRSAKMLGMHTIAVYSDADANAQHVQMADSAYHIGPAPSKSSYLDMDKLFAVAEQAGADCIHPGYGFLSENEAFAAQCEQKGITFIGPYAKSIEAMGSKTRAKEIMAGANVPLVPGYYGDNQDPTFLSDEADKIGYPVLIKAAYGGGGKGMRVVRDKKDFISALEGAKREAISSFGNDLVLIERYVDNPRHVEVQVFADKHGNCVYLGDRDCSLQRRHQKVIEEAPAPGLSDAMRKSMGEAAVRCAQAIDYVGAGTVEFLLCGEEFFFMEMNTRLQVEHPVTEMVTGVDLVQWQIATAGGDTLPLTQEQVEITGHSFEARLYAEDPSEQFMPSSGRLTHLRFPEQNANVRIDTGVTCGDEISSFYDPMVAKLIVKGDNRAQALSLLERSLRHTYVGGVKANTGFLVALCESQPLQDATMDTHFIDNNCDSLTQAPQADVHALAMAAWVYYCHLQGTSKAPAATSPWQSLSGFKLNSINEITVPLADHQLVLHVTSTGIKVDIDGQGHSLSGEYQGQGHYVAVVDGQRLSADAQIDDEALSIMYQGAQYDFALTSKHYVGAEQSGGDALAAPMNGTVVKHLLDIGTEVKQGDAIVVMEAMKMEYTLNAPFDGVLSSYCYGEGELVSHGALLAIVEEQE
ncbi:acetyl/propionyl/methylcrotonyl-CoA carboxylase subunit alpha [Pseudoalteromonas sp. T1lg76]|uniref:acetyl/propionyl/methylcrotonyl-CoA carboxylase subunit alpha n=1 Tax=Pseudoalteromonas sp. T1lg76 TaxID=2077103 RepID=UPI000CF6E758|nr:acetyl/propionyl/methylcrotonyl-CoA carboxylase subunit alpha [Pseudoalteromonas sp. T1lg76]